MSTFSTGQGNSSERGSAFIEFVLTFVMLLSFLWGAVDIGFYSYALISVQDAARMVALYNSSQTGNGDYNGACQYLLANLSKLPNMSGVSSCNASNAPLQFTLTSVTGPDNNAAVQVSVSYQTVQLIPFFAIPGRLTINRTVVARMRS